MNSARTFKCIYFGRAFAPLTFSRFATLVCFKNKSVHNIFVAFPSALQCELILQCYLQCFVADSSPVVTGGARKNSCEPLTSISRLMKGKKRGKIITVNQASSSSSCLGGSLAQAPRRLKYLRRARACGKESAAVDKNI